jgi:carbon-monoxide dehydrogenase small subunit
MPEKVSVRCRVNGRDATLHDFPMARLLDALREQLNLTGIKEGCGEGECGLVPVLQAEGVTIRTIEGLANGEQLHAVQRAFIAHGGAQCGICTPGMILAAVNLLDRNPHPTEAEVRVALAGNLCRCTGYTKIFHSVLAAFAEPEARG